MTETPFMVTLYFRGDDLNPELITKHLSVNPTDIRRKGEKRLGNQGRSYINKTGIWSLQATSTSQELSDHIQEITSKIGDLRNIRSITDIEDAFVDVFLCFERTEISDSYEFNLT